MDTKAVLRALVYGHDPERVREHLTKLLVEDLAQAHFVQPGQSEAETGGYGAGVYALFYVDAAHPLYGRMGLEFPVYIGRAIASLRVRLNELCLSVRHAASTLKVDCLRCKFLPMDECFVSCAETLLLRHYEPLWNTDLPGIGNHTPGKGRTTQVRSDWDTLHPGRPWAMLLPPSLRTPAELQGRVEKWLERRGM